MTDLLNKITMVIFLVVMIVIFVIALIMLWFYIRSKNRDKGVSEEPRKRNNIKKQSVDELLPIEDICDDMIIEKGGKRFSACIACTGSGFYNSNREEQVHTQNNYIEFLAALKEPICYRVHSENENTDYTLEKFYKARNELESALFNATEDFKEFNAFLKKEGVMDNESEQELVRLRKKMAALNWRIAHVDDEIKYINMMSSDTAKVGKDLYVLSWECSAGPAKNLMSETERYQKAKTELDKMCRVKIRQLSYAGVGAKRCSTEELIDICRKQTRPVTGNQFSIEQIKNSVDAGIVTTESVDRMNAAFDDDIINEMLWKEGL